MEISDSLAESSETFPTPTPNSATGLKLANGANSPQRTIRGSISLASPSLRPDDDSFSHPELFVEADRLQLESARHVYETASDPAQLKDALGKVLALATSLSEALTSLKTHNLDLQTANIQLIQTQTELETSLLLTQSNLTLERANNEMLEEALKRDGSAKDLGWKREGAKGTSGPVERPGTSRATTTPSMIETSAMQRRRSLSNASSGGTSASASVSPVAAHPPSITPNMVPVESSRFFKFRFGAAARDSLPAKGSPNHPAKTLVLGGTFTPPIATPAHLTSASLPSLLAGAGSPGNDTTPLPSRSHTPSLDAQPIKLQSEVEDLQKQLDTAREAYAKLQSTHAALGVSHKELADAKHQLEEEIENLSQALFEEANKMVADERRRCAAFEEELEVCRAEREALKGALGVVETENKLLKELAEPQLRDSTEEVDNVSRMTHGEDGDTSSTGGIKSRPSSPLLATSRPAEGLEGSDVQPSYASLPHS